MAFRAYFAFLTWWSASHYWLARWRCCDRWAPELSKDHYATASDCMISASAYHWLCSHSTLQSRPPLASPWHMAKVHPNQHCLHTSHHPSPSLYAYFHLDSSFTLYAKLGAVRLRQDSLRQSTKACYHERGPGSVRTSPPWPSATLGVQWSSERSSSLSRRPPGQRQLFHA